MLHKYSVFFEYHPVFFEADFELVLLDKSVFSIDKLPFFAGNIQFSVLPERKFQAAIRYVKDAKMRSFTFLIYGKTYRI